MIKTTIVSGLILAILMSISMPIVAHNSSGSDCDSLFTDWGVKILIWLGKVWDALKAKERWENAGWTDKIQAGIAAERARRAMNNAHDDAVEAQNHWNEHCGGG